MSRPRRHLRELAAVSPMSILIAVALRTPLTIKSLTPSARRLPRAPFRPASANGPPIRKILAPDHGLVIKRY
jgi:hypothetical protein